MSKLIKEDVLTKEEALQKEKFRFWWKVLLAVFAVACIGTIIYFAFFKDDSHVKLGKYKGLTYTLIDVSVSDEDVKKEKERLINMKVTYEKLTDRDGTAVAEGDIVNCSYKAKLNGEVLEEGSGNFEIGSGDFKDFEDKLVGKIVGDTVTISVTIPEGYETISKLEGSAGEVVDFEVSINFVSEKKVPELTNELVKVITGGECQAVDAFDSYIKDTLAKKKESDAETQIIHELLDKIINDSEFKDMDELVQEYYDTMYETYVSAAKLYELSMGEYVKQFYSMELEEFQKELKGTMVDLVKEQLVLEAIIKEEKLKLSSERYDTYLAQYMEDYGYTDKSAFIEYYGADAVEESMLYDYAIDFILDNAVAE